MLHGTHELTRLEQRIHRARIQPRIPAAQRTHVQRARIEIHAVEVRDLQFATRTRLDLLGEIDHTFVVEVQACHRIMRFRLGRLLFDRDGLLVLVKLNYAVTFRIVHIIAEYTCALAGLRLAYRTAQRGAQTIAVEDVVSQYQRARFAVDELFTQKECLRQTIRAGLHLVGEVHAIMRTVAQ